MYEEHLKTCEYCQKQKGASSLTTLTSKPTIYVKSKFSYTKQKKLTELGAIIKGISYPSLESIPMFLTKGASEVARARKPGPIEREVKLKELRKIIGGGKEGLVSYPDHSSHSRFLHRRRQSLN